MRHAGLLLMLAGCDVVFGLTRRPDDGIDAGDGGPLDPYESTTHDEDGDGVADAFDLCPHVNPNRDRDTDADGIGDDCDPRVDAPDRRLFFSFAEGDTRRLTSTGIFEKDVANDAVLLGAITDDLSYLTVDFLDAATADVVLHVTYVASAREETVPIGLYSELGIATFHRSHVDTRAQRGDICFAGSDTNVPPNYLEFDEDDADLNALTKRFDGKLVDATMTLEHHASPEGFGCKLTRATGSISNAHARLEPRTERGTVSIDAVRLRARLHYLWIVVPAAP